MGNSVNPGFIDLAKRPGSDGRGDCQWGWLDRVRDLFLNRTVLDVGSGNSTTKERLPQSIVTTHEPCGECGADIQCDISEIEGQWDAVLCLDVIEHVKDYGRFASHLSRLSRHWLFLTTPGAEVTANKSPYHFHEFHPWEIIQLLEAVGFTLDKAWAQRWGGEALYDGCAPANLLTGVIEVSRGELLAAKHLHPIALLVSK